jgi:hypothetical protein
VGRSQQRRRGTARGQAAIESALALPLLVFLVLGLLQLTLLEQAKLMTEYAAFQAARAGIVWNGNNERMRDAALVALLPTLGEATDNAPAMAAALAHARVADEAFQGLGWGAEVPPDINGSSLHGLVRVDTINPAGFPGVEAIWKLSDRGPWQELDFDGPAAYPDGKGLAAHMASFFDLSIDDAQEDLYRRATVLSVRVRYWYELRVPFANWLLFMSWYATNAGAALHGAIDRPAVGPNQVTGRVPGAPGLSNQKGYATAYPDEMAALWSVSRGTPPHFYFPLSATYSMRMQSNFNRKWLMHANPDWSPSP